MVSAESDTYLRSTFRTFWPYTRGNRRRMFVGGLFAVLVSAGEIGTVLIFESITDSVLAQDRMAEFWRLAATWLGIAVVTSAVMFADGFLRALTSQRFSLTLRDSVFAHAQQLSPAFFSKNRLGDLMVRLLDDVDVTEEMVCSGLVALAAAILSTILFAAAAIVIQWQLALVTFAIAPLFWLASTGFSNFLSRASAKERYVSGSYSSAVEESLANQALVQAFNRQAEQSRLLHEEGVSWLRANMAEAKLHSLYAPVIYFIETVCILTVFGFGAWEVAEHRLSIGGILSFAVLLTFIYPEIQSLSGYRAAIAAARASVQRVNEILESKPVVSDSSGVLPRARAEGRVEFEDVTFGYPEVDHSILKRISFSTEPGKLLAIVGPSGAGKSTVANLLLRFYDPDKGRILLDGNDIRDLSLRVLRDNVTILQQENLLFAGTVRENIAYGKLGATSDEIYAAARAASAHEFITGLPQGYDTPIGQRGRQLSGGQRQRIAIARTVLRDAPVLILDEPTSGLDLESARRVIDTFRDFLADRTTILITHDPSVAALADDVLSLPGRAAEA
jgi:ATP-binding cassette, subfamily B, bacterial